MVVPVKLGVSECFAVKWRATVRQLNSPFRARVLVSINGEADGGEVALHGVPRDERLMAQIAFVRAAWWVEHFCVVCLCSSSEGLGVFLLAGVCYD